MNRTTQTCDRAWLRFGRTDGVRGPGFERGSTIAHEHQAFTPLREVSDIGLRRALDVFSDRFELLKATSPEDFEVDLDHY
jgi:hypothetical protein